jgi:Domain of unknown function (DUF1707)
MARRAIMRASDADREQVADRLRHATAEGRLLAEELEQRLGAALGARTYGELDALVADLPAVRTERRRTGRAPWLVPALGLALAIPVALALIAAMLFIVTGVLAVWMVWIAVGWWAFGHKRRLIGGPPGPRRHSCARFSSQRRADAGPGGWL